MATKPVNNLAEWADSSNGGNYTGGPYAGQPRKVSIPAGVAAEGFRPGALDPSAAEHINDYLNQMSLFIRWVYDGSSAGAPDAHIVETNSTGRATLHGLTVTNTTTQTPVFATGNGVLAPVYRATNPNGGDGYVADLSGSTGSAFSSELEGSSKGLELVLENVDSPGVGVSITCDAATSADAISVTHAGTGNGIIIVTSGAGADAGRFVTSGTNTFGVYAQVDDATSIAVEGLCVDDGVAGGQFLGGTNSGVGVYAEAFADAAIFAEGGVPSSAAILALGKSTAAGVRGSGGPGGANGVEGNATGTGTAGVWGLGSSIGTQGTATDDSLGVGVYGLSALAGGPFAAGVQGQGRGDAKGGDFLAEDGYGVAIAAPGERAHILMAGRNTDPSNVSAGVLWHRTSQGIKTFVAGVVRFLWHTAGGAAAAWDYSASGVVDDTGGAACTCTLTGANSPVVTGTVMLIAVVEVGRNSGTPNVVATLFDNTVPVAVVGPDTVRLYQAAGVGVYEKFIVYVYPRLLPSAGDRTFSLELKSDTAGEDINYRNAGLFAVGVF